MSGDFEAKEFAKSADLQSAVQSFQLLLGGVMPDWAIKKRPDGAYLMFEFAKPSERLYRLIARLEVELPEANAYSGRCSLVSRAKKPEKLLSMPETRLLQREIAESLTVDQNTFGGDFMLRYTKSVSDMEHAIVARANHVVYGRRGAGKSSLLAYAFHSLRLAGHHAFWISMQTYSGRSDDQAAAAVIAEVLRRLESISQSNALESSLIAKIESLSISDSTSMRENFLRLIPKIKQFFTARASQERPITLFLDDLHVVAQTLQPRLLSYIYSVCRANNCYLKISGIEQLTRLWDSENRVGIEAPHDAQILELDYNLTMPDKSMDHIRSILDAHAQYCGFPDVKYLCTDEVLARLVLVAAAVPRDALSLFSQAISNAAMKGQKKVSVTSVNEAASEAAEEKLKDIERDAKTDQPRVRAMLDRVKTFCILRQRKNSFLVRIRNSDDSFEDIKKLVALRLVHVLHEGITPHKAGERFVALMLDYGFYVGVRAARSVELFPNTPKLLLAKDLRGLPIFEG